MYFTCPFCDKTKNISDYFICCNLTYKFKYPLIEIYFNKSHNISIQNIDIMTIIIQHNYENYYLMFLKTITELYTVNMFQTKKVCGVDFSYLNYLDLNNIIDSSESIIEKMLKLKGFS